MKSRACIFLCVLASVCSNTGLAESKIKFDSQSVIQVKKIKNNKVFQQELVKKDFEILGKKVSDLDAAEQKRIAKQGNKNPAILQAYDDRVRDQIQSIAQFLQSSSIPEAAPDFSHAVLFKLSALTKARRDMLLLQNATAMTMEKFAAPLPSPQERIAEIQSLLNKQSNAVSGI